VTVTELQNAEDTRDFSQGAAFIDGGFCPIADAKISVLDFGMTRSDCTYDVAHVWKGRFFRLDKHLDRFMRSVDRLHLQLPFDRDELERTLHKCVALAGLEDAYVSMTSTRGRPSGASRDPRLCDNNFYCFAVPFIWLATPEQQDAGLKMHVSSIPRIHKDSVDPTIKNYHWMDLEMSLFEAYENDTPFTCLKDMDGNITEGPGYNIFAYRDGKWTTPESGVLEGITRGAALDLCKELNVDAVEGTLTDDALRTAEEIIVTSTAGGIMPVIKLDGKDVGDGVPGPVSERLRQLYWDKHTDTTWSSAVNYG
jgi:branched-chain amino acid aminotransferase